MLYHSPFILPYCLQSSVEMNNMRVFQIGSASLYFDRISARLKFLERLTNIPNGTLNGLWLSTKPIENPGRGVLDISLSGEVRPGPSNPDPV